MTAARIFTMSIKDGLRTIAFTQSRVLTELMHRWSRQMAPRLESKISSYRAGFLPEERREIERKLNSGELLGVISTSALEMGLDIGALEVCLLVGYPGSIINTWQRGGRVGRADQESVVIMLAQPDALDQYFMRHPQNFFSRGLNRRSWIRTTNTSLPAIWSAPLRNCPFSRTTAISNPEKNRS